MSAVGDDRITHLLWRGVDIERLQRRDERMFKSTVDLGYYGAYFQPSVFPQRQHGADSDNVHKTLLAHRRQGCRANGER